MGNYPSKKMYKKKLQDRSSEPSGIHHKTSFVQDYIIKRSSSVASFIKTEEESKELDRQQREHYMLKMIRKGNIAAVLDSPSVIIQSGIRGNGIWALDTASQYPKAKVIGLDLKLPDLQLANQTFYQTHLLRPWPVRDNYADFVFQRCMNLRIEKDQWLKVLKEMWRTLKPGGQVELVEPELFNHRQGPYLDQIQNYYQKDYELNNLDFDLSLMDTFLAQAGFENIQHTTYDIPLGEWPEDPELRNFGFMNLELRKSHTKIRRNDYIQQWHLTPQLYDTMINQAIQETERYQTFSRYHCWVARKK
ncbi:S-adenosyl-L-methionine-dependent methyltransferase [Sporodiniella umbellata]|nr:S-adenosyl-L-methionine-dependent methyltransferase [Sporodiniella umbellata]